jgi:glycosyltransferase involved in cell wall biosynthesis
LRAAGRRARILCIVNSLFAGGAERHLVDLVCQGIAKDRFSADVVCLKPRPDGATDTLPTNDLGVQLKDSGVRVQDGWLRHKYDPSAIRNLLCFMAQTRPDIVYTHTGTNELLLAWIARVVRGVHTVCAVHTTKNTAAGQHFSAPQRLLMRRASRVVGVAASHRQYLLGSEGLHEARTVCIYNGVDETRFHPKIGPRVDLAPNLVGRRVVGVVGNLLWEKGQHVLLEGMPRVVEQHPDVALVFVGSDPSPRRHVESALRARARQLGIDERVIFLGYRPDMECVLHGLDLFVLPSLPMRETFSIAALEAMASGLPVLVTRVGSLQDMITDGKEGFLVESNDSSVLANRLNLLLGDPVRARAMGMAGRRRVERNFTLDRMVDQYTALFDCLVQRSG